MKRILAILLCVSMLFVLCACGKEKKPTAASQPETGDEAGTESGETKKESSGGMVPGENADAPSGGMTVGDNAGAPSSDDTQNAGQQNSPQQATQPSDNQQTEEEQKPAEPADQGGSANTEGGYQTFMEFGEP